MNSKLIASSALLCLIMMLKINGNDAVLGLSATTASVAESVAAGSSMATLAGSGASGYTYVLKTTPTIFEIATANLKLKSASSLDFETTASYTLVITVSASGETDVDVTFVITVTDANEAPMFAMTSYPFSVNNMAGAGTVIGTVTATDVDASVNGNIASYTITAGDTDSVFTVGTDGMIKIAANKYANATTTTAYVLTYRATDGGTPGLTVDTSVVVGVNVCAGVSRLVGGGLTAVILASAVLVANYL